jgi:hypothetical protein
MMIDSAATTTEMNMSPTSSPTSHKESHAHDPQQCDEGTRSMPLLLYHSTSKWQCGSASGVITLQGARVLLVDFLHRYNLNSVLLSTL